MIYIHCPNCGHKLLEGEKGSIVNVKCNKCNILLKAALQENEVRLVIKQQAETVK